MLTPRSTLTRRIAAALDAATWGARAWLGHPGIAEGAQADVVVLADDPREDVAALQRPRAVVLRGVAY